MTRSTYPQPALHQDMTIPRRERHAIANKAWLAKRDADRAELSGDEYRFWAVVRMWGSMTLDREDATRVALATSLQAKGRVTTSVDGDCVIVRLVRLS